MHIVCIGSHFASSSFVSFTIEYFERFERHDDDSTIMYGPSGNQLMGQYDTGDGIHLDAPQAFAVDAFAVPASILVGIRDFLDDTLWSTLVVLSRRLAGDTFVRINTTEAAEAYRLFSGEIGDRLCEYTQIWAPCGVCFDYCCTWRHRAIPRAQGYNRVFNRFWRHYTMGRDTLVYTCFSDSDGDSIDS